MDNRNFNYQNQEIAVWGRWVEFYQTAKTNLAISLSIFSLPHTMRFANFETTFIQKQRSFIHRPYILLRKTHVYLQNFQLFLKRKYETCQ